MGLGDLLVEGLGGAAHLVEVCVGAIPLALVSGYLEATQHVFHILHAVDVVECT